jgi:hypothetical protein
MKLINEEGGRLQYTNPHGVTHLFPTHHKSNKIIRMIFKPNKVHISAIQDTDQNYKQITRNFSHSEFGRLTCRKDDRAHDIHIKFSVANPPGKWILARWNTSWQNNIKTAESRNRFFDHRWIQLTTHHIQ